jgi:phosphatidylserine decarboxylase
VRALKLAAFSFSSNDFELESLFVRKLLRKLGLAEYGGDELLIAIVACGAAALALWLLNPLLALLPLIPFAIVIWFFRDPERTGPTDENLLLAPADGTVTDIVEIDELEFICGKATRVGIFLSPFNVHVNRVPCAGTVRAVGYKTGEFLPAYNPEAPQRNESVSLGFETAGHVLLLVKQITGVLARRIVCETPPGTALTRGQRYGMIKFGSRTELYIPTQWLAEVTVKIGDSVRGGQSVCCKLRTTPAEATRADQFEGSAALAGPDPDKPHSTTEQRVRE